MKAIVIIAVILMVMVWIGIQSMVTKHNEGVREQIEEAETGVPRWKKKEAQTAVEESRLSWKRAHDALKSHNHTASFRGYRDAMTAFSVYAKHYSDKEVEPGVTYKVWLDEKDQKYRKAMAEEYEWVLQQLETGDISVGEARQIVNNFSTTDFKDLKGRYEEEKERIAAARARLAGKWFRVTLSGYTYNYEEVIKKILRKKWNDRYGVKLVFGWSLDNLEQRATWKNLDIMIEQKDSGFSFQSEEQKIMGGSTQIPEMVKLSFKHSGNKTVSTNWTELADVTARVELPESILVSVGKRGGLDAKGNRKIQAIQSEYMQKLQETLSDELDKLPVFQIFPDKDSSKLKVLKDGKIDSEAVRALGYLDRKNLTSQLKSLRLSGNTSGIEELLAVLIELNMEDFSGFVTKRIVKVDQRKLTPIFNELKKKPWYGDYEPLHALIKSNKNPSGDILTAMQGQMRVLKNQQLFLDRIKDPDFYPRPYYARLLIIENPIERTSKYAERWLTDKDEHFATVVYIALARKDRQITHQIALEHFDQLHDKTKSFMLRDLVIKSEGGNEQILKVLKQIIGDEESGQLRHGAYNVLKIASYIPDAWDVLKEMADTEKDSRLQTDIIIKLIMNVGRAHPEMAEDFLYRNLKSKESRVRHQAMLALLGSKKSKGSVIHTLAGLLQKSPSDQKLLEQIVFSIHQYHRIRKGWNFAKDQTELTNILQLGGKHSDKRVRESAYVVMGYALKEGHDHYRPHLEAALQSEKEEILQKKIQKLLAI